MLNRIFTEETKYYYKYATSEIIKHRVYEGREEWSEEGNA